MHGARNPSGRKFENLSALCCAPWGVCYDKCMNTTATAQLADQTPAQIDTQLAALYSEKAKIAQTIEHAYSTLHYKANDKKRYYGRSRVGMWTMTDQQALDTVHAMLDAGTLAPYDVTSTQQTLANLVVAQGQLNQAKTQIAELDAEYMRRPWSRFLEVTSSNGHIHSSMFCSTCNNGKQMTEFAWHPQLSGLTEAEAVAQLGPLLCSTCFASAPVEWKRDRADVNRERKAAQPKPVKAGPFASISYITNGYPQRETFKTAQMAQNWVVKERAEHEAYGYAICIETVSEVTEMLIAAGFVTQEVLDAKVAAKVKRDKREGEKHARALGLIK